MGNFLAGPFSFSGRIGRARYWLLSLLYLLGYVVLSVLLITIGIMTGATLDSPITIVMAILFILVLIPMAIAVASIGVRRLHDRGKTGWWLLLYYAVPLWTMPQRNNWQGGGLVFQLVCLGVLIWALVDLGCLRGEAGSNIFGQNPLSEKS
jgi:uncharacterized membrane protein YhaH (DUF805 family)